MSSSTMLTFQLKVQGQPDDLFRVQTFSLEDHLSEPFRLELTAVTEKPNLGYDDLIGKPASLIVTGDDLTVHHHGMITGFQQHPDHSEDFGGEAYLYEIVIEPRLKQLHYAGQNRIFQKLKVDGIIKQVLEGHGLKTGDDFKFDLRGTHSVREFTVQYNETDLNFISRLMEDEGIFYYFAQTKNEALILTDDVTSLPSLGQDAVQFVQESGLSHLHEDHITKLIKHTRMVTTRMQAHDYNPDTPGTQLVGSTGKGKSEIQAFAPGTLTVEDLTRWVGRRLDMLQAEKIVIRGEGIMRAFKAGLRFTLEDGPHSQFEGKYIIVGVMHRGDQREGFESDEARRIYDNTFVCIPDAIAWRPPLRAQRPRVHGVITARVDGPDDPDYAYLDEEGRYRVRLPFDQADSQPGQASLPVRLNQPYGGAKYGTHFPIHKGNDLLLTFIDGDVDRPIALGTIPTPANASPVSSRNKAESVIKTHSGHVLRLDDTKDKTAIDLTTTGKHQIALLDEAEKKSIHITTTDTNQMVFDDKEENIRVATKDQGHLIKLDNKNTIMTLQTKYGHIITLDDASKSLALQTKNGHLLKIDDDKKLISMQDGDGKHVFQIDIGESKISITTEGDLELMAKGSLNIEAKEISMNAKQGTLTMKSMKDMSLEGMNFNAKGKQKLALEGTTEASMKGLKTTIEATTNLELSGKVQAKLTGAMASVEGSAMTQVKGAMVMIN